MRNSVLVMFVSHLNVHLSYCVRHFEICWTCIVNLSYGVSQRYAGIRFRHYVTTLQSHLQRKYHRLAKRTLVLIVYLIGLIYLFLEEKVEHNQAMKCTLSALPHYPGPSAGKKGNFVILLINTGLLVTALAQDMGTQQTFLIESHSLYLEEWIMK
jgi:hypothetical protein